MSENTPQDNRNVLKTPLSKGKTIGMLGGGQLGQMFADAAVAMGYKVCVFCPDENPPAARSATSVIQADYTDTAALKAFSDSVDVVTLEFENIPLTTLDYLETLLPVAPGRSVLEKTQHRLLEKTFLKTNGFPVTPFVSVTSESELAEALHELGFPSILKTATLGYDGKGQIRIKSEADIPKNIDYSTSEWVLEQWVRFKAECSVVLARTADGRTAHFDVFENTHEKGVLDVTVMPALLLSLEVQLNAIKMALNVAEAIGLVGVMCVEFFVTEDNRLLINELAPRTHNSGHLTLEACNISQFQLQVEAACALPLTNPVFQPKNPEAKVAVMANLLGDVWYDQDEKVSEPDWALLDSESDAYLHLYGKAEARRGRKMGHLTVLGIESSEAEVSVRVLRSAVSMDVTLEKTMT